MSLRLGVGLPQVYGAGPARPEELLRVATTAEELGFDSVWTQEDVLGPSGTLDPLSVLSFVASHTHRVDLGVAVLLAPVMDPVQLAKTTATLDQLSGGRLVVGLGFGDNPEEYAAHGVPASDRARRFDHVVDAVVSLWAGTQGRLAGSPFRLEGAEVSPPPLQRPGPRLWFGGHADAALARALEWGNGFIGGGAMGADDFAAVVARLAALGDGRTDLRVAKRVYLACTEHHADARRRLLRWLTGYYGSSELAERVAVVGDAGQVVEALAELVAAGADELILNFVFEEELAVEAAAHEIVPALRRAARAA